ncbi:MAG: hypothetical protein IIY93_11030, partial [Clostridia bacterium]|nr:hypothetical protein [Clostridia bacterium]
ICSTESGMEKLHKICCEEDRKPSQSFLAFLYVSAVDKWVASLYNTDMTDGIAENGYFVDSLPTIRGCLPSPSPSSILSVCHTFAEKRQCRERLLRPRRKRRFESARPVIGCSSAVRAAPLYRFRFFSAFYNFLWYDSLGFLNTYSVDKFIRMVYHSYRSNGIAADGSFAVWMGSIPIYVPSAILSDCLFYNFDRKRQCGKQFLRIFY